MSAPGQSPRTPRRRAPPHVQPDVGPPPSNSAQVSPEREPPPGAGATSVDSGDTPETARDRLRNKVAWTVAAVATAAIAAVVTLTSGKIVSWWSERDPIQVVAVPDDPTDIRPPAAGGRPPSRPWGEDYELDLLVSDPSRLPASIGQVDDCTELWNLGLTAGGQPIHRFPAPSSRRTRMNLVGNAKDGLTIVSMRAQVTQALTFANRCAVEM
jgi:hypothetical protein